ncbi:tetratricopeptide repeat protein, partial [candidate division WOR-3 bacterium]|nr:tetratricopeptide repeat protein [candidate division WOR-3 bacterium]
EEACTYYEELLQNCKDKELRAAAMMGVADCYLAENDPIGAKEKYLELVDKYPESVLAPYALYRAALCVADTNEKHHILRRLLEEYPRSNYAKLIRAHYPDLGLSRE